MERYDLLVIGGGTAGLVAAAGGAGLGARVALIERERLGGECLWTGCVPSKALIAAGHVVDNARQGRRMGVKARDIQVDFSRVKEWVSQSQDRLAPHDSPERFRGLGVDVVQGNARFTGVRAVDVDGRALSARHVLIATGSSAAVPPISGLDKVPYDTNETIFGMEQQPETLLVLGGGPIGLELAQAFARLGTIVHVVETETQLLSREDHELAEMLADRLRADGVQLHLGSKATRVERRDGGGIRLTLRMEKEDSSETVTLDGDELLVATGRTARFDGLEPEAGGVAIEKDGVRVDEYLRTSAERTWAAGDCVGPFRFTHVADYHARLVLRNAFFPFHSKVDYSVIPWVTFTDPELAHVGLTEHEAREKHGDGVRVWRRPFADVDRAVTDGATHGMVKLVTNARGKILGGHILGTGAGNMIGEIVLAMKQGISATALGNTMHAYPTYPEAVKQAAEQYTKSRFTGVAKRLVNWYVRR